MRLLDVSGYVGNVTVTAAYSEAGETLGIAIIEADPKIRVTAGLMITILNMGPPWARFEGNLLHLTDGEQSFIYHLDGVDKVAGTFYFSWVE